MNPKDEIASMLARQIIGMDDLSRRHPTRLKLPPDVAQAHAEVEIRLESMVHGIVERVWLDTAAIAATVEAKVRDAVSDVSLANEVARVVESELARLRADITRRVREKIEAAIDRAVDERLGNGPRKLAARIADRMWDAFSNVARQPSNIYGRRGGGRKRK